MYVYIYIYMYIYMCIYIYIYIYIVIPWGRGRDWGAPKSGRALVRSALRPVHLLRVVLLRVLESNFPGDSLKNSTDMRIPTP